MSGNCANNPTDSDNHGTHTTGTIGKANNDGSPSDPTFAAGLAASGGVASNGTYVWWGRSGNGTSVP